MAIPTKRKEKWQRDRQTGKTTIAEVNKREKKALRKKLRESEAEPKLAQTVSQFSRPQGLC